MQCRESDLGASGFAAFQTTGKDLFRRFFNAPQVTVYDSPGSHTWTKPEFASEVEVLIVGGGGGGGGGRRWASGAGKSGGGGGGPGAVTFKRFLASSLGSTVSVVVGAGGIGGASRTVQASGLAGSNGDQSSFGSEVAAGGAAGGGGTSSSGSGGGTLAIQIAYGLPLASITSTGRSGTATGALSRIAAGRIGPGGGGGASGLSSANALGTGGTGLGRNGCAVLDFESLVYELTELCRVLGGAAGANGSVDPVTRFGSGGGGGSAFTNADGQSGGNGAAGGGGGGGGGGSIEGYNSGAGGNGGCGLVIVYCY